VSLDTLPRTIRDAVIITRKLNIQYIWVDTLCILQDSALEWARESAKMDGIYSGATVVLAAATSKNDDEETFAR